METESPDARYFCPSVPLGDAAPLTFVMLVFIRLPWSNYQGMRPEAAVGGSDQGVGLLGCWVAWFMPAPVPKARRPCPVFLSLPNLVPTCRRQGLLEQVLGRVAVDLLADV